MMQTTPVTCKSCGTQFVGTYCNHCGEKVYSAHDKKLSHFLEESFHFITHFDSKFFKSFGFIFFRPGFLAKEFSEGKRKKYFSPISLFLVGVVIYLLFPLLQGMNISFDNHLNNNNFLHFYLPQQWAEHKVSVEHLSLEQLAEKFDHLSPKFSKVLLVILIPLSALVLALLFRRKRLYYFDHLMMAAEFNAFYLYYTFLILPAFIMLLSKVPGMQVNAGDNLFFLLINGLIVLVVLTMALRRFYHARFIFALLKGILFYSTIHGHHFCLPIHSLLRSHALYLIWLHMM